MFLYNYFIVPLLCVFILIFYLLTCSFQLNSFVISNFIVFDEISFFIIYITCFVMFISFMFCMVFISKGLTFVISSMLFVCCAIFFTNRIFIFYLFYEASLIPILYIIMKWGSYPERSVRSIILLVYTSVFTFPFIYVLFRLYSLKCTLIFCFFYSTRTSSLFFSILIFSTFAVKLPVYGLHFWLPMAHVEAPTFGSIVLAGVLLKLGGVGLIRFSVVIDIAQMKSIVLGYFFIFLVYVTLLCSFQSDFKRLVAYSSVSHIITIPIMMFSSSCVSYKGIIRIMFLHGVRSPLIFMLVGISYLLMSTRQHFLMRGLVCFSPLLSFLMVLSFFFNLSAPPFPSFVAEVFFSISMLATWLPGMIFLFAFIFLSLVYNLM